MENEVKEKLPIRERMTLDQFLLEKEMTFGEEMKPAREWLTEEQYAYIKDVVEGNRHIANYSVAGSGKSLCLELIKSYLGDSCAVFATTGIANAILFNNEGGNGTMHSGFSLPLNIHTPEDVKKVSPKCSNIFASSDLVRTVIIEEAGMMSPDHLALIVKRLRRFNKEIKGKRRERKIKLVLQGDFLQVPMIASDDEVTYMRKTYGSDLLFESDVFNNLNFKTHIFTKILRTNDKTFQACLDVIRYGQSHRYENCLKWLNKRYKPAPDNIPVVTTTNKSVAIANKENLDKNPNRLYTLYAQVSGNYNVNNCPAEEVIYLKEGCPVISLMNNQDEHFFNGSFGYVTQVIPYEGVIVKFSHSGEEKMVPYFKYEEKEYYTDKDESGKEFMNNRVIGTCLQCPVKMAAAFSVFRVQGRTIDSPILIDLGWGFPQTQAHNWGSALAYVSLSRATCVENIYLKQKLTHKHIKVLQRAVDWVKEQMNE